MIGPGEPESPKMMVHTLDELGAGAKKRNRQLLAEESAGEGSAGPKGPEPARKIQAAVAGDDSSASVASAFAARPLPLRSPLFPESRKMKDIKKWNLECRRIAKSKIPDGTEILQSTGIVVGWDEAKRHARIVTCSNTVCHRGRLLDPKPKEVFILARDDESSLMARHGTILWSEESDYLGRNHYMFASSMVPEGGTGGPVIDHDGRVIGMAFNISVGKAVFSISTILTFIQMWTKFSRIARPILGISLKTMELLDISLQEEIFLNYNLNDGFIVDEVCAHSAAEILGFRRGDVIVSFDGQCVSTLPQLEDFLLCLGWGFLQRSTDSSYMVNLKLGVHDLLGRARADITLPVGFSDASERVYRTRMT